MQNSEAIDTLVVYLMIVWAFILVGIGMHTFPLPWDENEWKAGVLFVVKWGCLFLLWCAGGILLNTVFP